MEGSVDFFPLLVVTLLAVAVPVLLQRFSRLGIPIVAGEIAAGIVVGPASLGLIEHTDPWLDFLKLFGFVYLMFLSGLEIDFSLLLRGSGDKSPARVPSLVSTPLRAALWGFAITLALSYAFSLWLVRLGWAENPIVLSLILSTTSLGVVMPVLKERRLVSTDLGQYILVAAVVADFATVLLVSIYVTVQTSGLTFDILLVLVLLIATFAIYRLAHFSRRHLPLERLVDELSHATGQLDIRGSLALAVVFIALAQGLGVEIILGAFMAGAIVSLVSEEKGSQLRPKLNALGYGFFVPIFFIMVGVDFDLKALIEAPRGLAILPILLVIAFNVKLAAALICVPQFSWREILGMGSLTSARLSLIIAVSAIGMQIGAITPAMNSAIILLSICTVLIFPPLFNKLVSSPPRRASRVAVIGSAPQARLLAERMRRHGNEVVVVTSNADFLGAAQAQGLDLVPVKPGGHLQGVGREAVVESEAAVIVLDDDELTYRLAVKVRHDLGIETVVAVVQDPAIAADMKREDVQVVEPGLSLVINLEAMIRYPQAFSLVAQMDLSKQVREVRMRNPMLNGRNLREVRLPGDALVLLVTRGGEQITPRGDTALRHGDWLTVVGSSSSVNSASNYLTGAA